MQEALIIWGQDTRISCVLSIGTGAPPVKRLGRMPHRVLMACKDLATETEATARAFKKGHGLKLAQESKYYRFNVIQGLQQVQLEEWEATDLIDSATKVYLDDVDSDIQSCVQAMILPRRDSDISEFTNHNFTHFSLIIH
jgi:hypothetical protein